MIRVSLKEAEERLSDLIDEVTAGEEVVITATSGLEIQLVPLESLSDHGLRAAKPGGRVVGHSLDRYIGTWSKEEEAELLKAVEAFEQIDESLWS